MKRTAILLAGAALQAALVMALAQAAPAMAQTMDIPVPSRGLMPNPGRGKALYAEHCGECHGADLRGSQEGPPMLHRYYEPSHHSDAAFQRAVRYGTRMHHWEFGDMEPVTGLSADDVAHITAYIRMEQRKVGIH